MVDAEVLVVGGSVAGAATALHLARLGHSVLVLDRAQFPREKVCGEGLMPHGVRAIERLGLLDALLETQPQRFYGIHYVVGSARAEGCFPKQRFGLGLRRLHLDRLLGEALAAEGVELRAGERVKQIERTPEGWSVQTSKGSHRAKVLVAADGLHSRLRGQLGLDRSGRGRRRYGLRQHVKLAPGKPVPKAVEVHVADEVEFYITPTGPGQVNVAVLCGEEVARRFEGGVEEGLWGCVERYAPMRELLDGSEPVSEAAMLGPLRQQSRDVVADGAVLVGDAAGFVDALTGEGMSIALLSAELAADVVSQALRRGVTTRRALRPYARRRRKMTRQLLWLTEIVLWGVHYRPLAERVVSNLGRRPELFGRVLAVNSGEAPIWSLGPRAIKRMVVG